MSHNIKLLGISNTLHVRLWIEEGFDQLEMAKT